MKKKIKHGPNVLFLDIETAPILAYVWSLWDQNVSLNQIKKDWFILSWSAKWSDSKEVMYMDQSKSKNIENDKDILKQLWKLLDTADVVVTQNGKAFDHKKINARFMFHGIQPPSSFKIIDIYLIAKKHFAFTSNKLEYMSEKFNVKYKKLSSSNRKFVGFELWRACLSGVKAAWKEMKVYNKYDVLALEELYQKLIPWEPRLNIHLYNDDITEGCNSCGHSKLVMNGHTYTEIGKYQRYKCVKCGAEVRGRENLLSKEKRKSLKVRTNR